MSTGAQLGLGLLSIGKPWGFRRRPVPSYEEAEALIAVALELGIRYLDTAASYGDSEEKLGRFLSGRPDVRRTLKIATKFGEHWDSASGTPFVDHSYDRLARSLDTSLRRLGQVDVLQVHKASVEALRSRDVERALEYARRAGVPTLGASVSDPEAGRLALALGWVSVLQCPYNRGNSTFSEVIAQAQESGVRIVVNRPLGEGRLLYEPDGAPRDLVALAGLMRHAASPLRDGVVLVGTASPAHLSDNVEAFRRARRS